jgi:hypothetical protein
MPRLAAIVTARLAKRTGRESPTHSELRLLDIDDEGRRPHPAQHAQPNNRAVLEVVEDDPDRLPVTAPR